MSFFDQLASVARRVDKDVKELKSVADQPFQRAQREKDLDEQEMKASLLLRNLETEVRDLKRDIQQNLSELRGNGFLELVAAAQALVEKEKEIMTHTETYLQKYGYEPLAPPPSVDKEGVKESQAEHICNDETVVLTNSKFVAPSSTIGATAGNRPVPTGVFLDSPQLPVLITPGVKQIATKSRIDATMLEENHSDTPEMPVLQTPGVKQIARHSKIAETIQTESKSDTPEMPVMQTPGVKQFAKSVFNNAPSASFTPPPDATLRSVSDTPEMPELTYNFKDIQLLMAKYTNQPSGDQALPQQPPQLQTRPEPNTLAPSPQMPDMTSQLPLMSSQMPIITSQNSLSVPQLSHQSGQPTLHETGSLPQMPLCTAVTSEKNASRTPDLPPTSSFTASGYTLQRNSVVEDDGEIPFPEMPELVGTYNFTAMLNQGGKAMQGGQGIEDKENQAPPVISRAKSMENMPLKRGICMITESEYGAQPGYMTKNITLDQLNNHVREMQALLDRNARDSNRDFLTEAEIKELLGFDANYLLLFLTRLNKLTTIHVPNCQQPAYRPA